MNLRHIVTRALSLPLHVVLNKAICRVLRRIILIVRCRLESLHPTYSDPRPVPQGNLFCYFPGISVVSLKPWVTQIASVTKHYLAHRFNLLGSGWVQVRHGLKCLGLEVYSYDMSEPVQPDSDGRWLVGRINKANVPESQRNWRLIFQPINHDLSARTYCPIDWQLDYKSGYRWSESTWYRDIRYGHKLGVDVKVPWELARMQHLPQITIAYALAVQSSKLKAQRKKDGQKTESENQKSRNNQMEAPELYVLEFRSQVLDFIATNPPRFGVNWACTMDVGIRVANWLAAYDLFYACGAQFDRKFMEVFKRSIYEHGLHIINNLEWNEEHRSNHYLSDIAGLLFVAAYLPCSPEIDAWLAFAVQELITEVEGQFYPDGGNFEASTSYHRLSSEIVIYATALVLGLPEEKVNALRHYDHTVIKVRPGLRKSPLPHYKLSVKNNPKSKIKNQKSESPFPMWYFERLEKMAEFTMHITKPNVHITQIGDNDSGRFFKFQPAHKKMTVAQAKKKYRNLNGYKDLPDEVTYWDEDFLDHSHLVAAINGLFNRDDFTAFAGNEYLETDLVRDIAREITLSSYKKTGEPTIAEKVRIKSDNSWDELYSELENMPVDQKQTINIPLPDAVLDDLKLYAYPTFGFYIYHSKRLYLAVRCGSIGQNGNGGHAHNDQLSMELNIEGKDIIADPGTYLYTPLPKRRNEYRSVSAHFAPQPLDGKEPGRLDYGLFRIEAPIKSSCIHYSESGFIAKIRKSIYKISLDKAAITITLSGDDFILPTEKSVVPLSKGYGEIERVL